MQTGQELLLEGSYSVLATSVSDRYLPECSPEPEGYLRYTANCERNISLVASPPFTRVHEIQNLCNPGVAPSLECFLRVPPHLSNVQVCGAIPLLSQEAGLSLWSDGLVAIPGFFVVPHGFLLIRLLHAEKKRGEEVGASTPVVFLSPISACVRSGRPGCWDSSGHCGYPQHPCFLRLLGSRPFLAGRWAFFSCPWLSLGCFVYIEEDGQSSRYRGGSLGR